MKIENGVHLHYNSAGVYGRFHSCGGDYDYL